MSKNEDFLKGEKNIYGKIFIDINYAIDTVSPFLEETVLNSRKYVANLPVLKKYMDLIAAAESETQKGGFLNFFSPDKYSDLLAIYKKDNNISFKQLEKCKNCSCLNCTADCKFDSCLGCRAGACIVKCDHIKINAIFHDNFTLSLTNDSTGRHEQYIVLATLQDAEKDQRYIIIEGISTKEKFILYYYPGISEDTYGEISDPQEFDFIVATYNSIPK